MAKAVKIKATVMWANLQAKNEMSGKYQVDLCNLTPGAVGALEDMGLNVTSNPNKPDKGFYITPKSTNPIRAYNEAGDDISDVMIGNGSEAVATVSFYDWENKFGSGRSPSLRKLVITDLALYEDGEDALEVDDEVL